VKWIEEAITEVTLYVVNSVSCVHSNTFCTQWNLS